MINRASSVFFLLMMMSLVDVEEGHISDVEITINRLKSPPTAEANFLAVGRGKDRKGEFPYQGFAQRVKVQLQLQGGRWLVTGYELLDFIGQGGNCRILG